MSSSSSKNDSISANSTVEQLLTFQSTTEMTATAMEQNASSNQLRYLSTSLALSHYLPSHISSTVRGFSLLLLSIWMLSWFHCIYGIPNDQSHLLSISGCECVSACRPSIYRKTPWCHVKHSFCNPSNTIQMNDSFSQIHDLNPNAELHQIDIAKPPSSLSFPSLSLSPPTPFVNSPQESQEPQNVRDVLETIGNFVESFLNLGVKPTSSSNQRRSLQQHDSDSHCTCHQDVVGIWDFCDPLTTKRNVEHSSDYELPPFDTVNFSPAERPTATTPQPIPLLLLQDQGTKMFTESSEVGRRSPDLKLVESESSGFHVVDDRCHSTCKTCTKSSRGFDTECLTCYHPPYGPSPKTKYHLIVVGRSNLRQQGRCVPITSDSDICHPTCNECRADCCAKSARACVTCPLGSSFRPGPHKTVGQCLPFLSSAFTSIETVPEDPLPHHPLPQDWSGPEDPHPHHPLPRDWSGLLNSENEQNSIKHIEDADGSIIEKVFPFSESLHPAVSSWLLRESQAANRTPNDVSSETDGEKHVIEDNDDGESIGSTNSRSVQEKHERNIDLRNRWEDQNGVDLTGMQSARRKKRKKERRRSPQEERTLLNEIIESSFNESDLSIDDGIQEQSEKRENTSKILQRNEGDVNGVKKSEFGIKSESIWDLGQKTKASIPSRSRCDEIEEYLKLTNPGMRFENNNILINETQTNNHGFHFFDLWKKRPSSISGKRYWLQLVYLHADNNILDAGLSDLSEMRQPKNPLDFVLDKDRGLESHSADYMHLVVLIDPKKEEISSIDDDHPMNPLSPLWTTFPSMSQIMEMPMWSIVTSPFEWLFGTKTIRNSYDIKVDAELMLNRDESIIDGLKIDVFSNDSLHHKQHQRPGRRVWSIPGDDQLHHSYRRRLDGLVSKNLGNIVICPNSEFTDDTKVNQFNPDNGEAFELYRVPTNLHSERPESQSYDWLLLRRHGEVNHSFIVYFIIFQNLKSLLNMVPSFPSLFQLFSLFSLFHKFIFFFLW